MTRHDPLHYFELESREIVAGLEAQLLAYDGGTDELAELFRLAHTLKGGARVVRQTAASDLAHAMEDVLSHHREAGTSLSRQEVAELLKLLDAIRRALGAATPEATKSAASNAQAAAELGVLRIALADMDELASGVLEAEGHAGALRSRVAMVGEVRRGLDGLVDRLLGAEGSGLDSRSRAALDDLVAGLAEHQRHLATLADRVELELRQLAQRTAVLRLVDASAVFPELERAVFDAAEATGRQARFVARGGDVKIDAHVLSPMRSALLHLVRNAVAHGIESPAERRAAGKPATGTVEVAVERRGGRVAFVVRDDGRGIDRDAVKRAAESRGISLANDGGPAEPAEELIFRPGVSTASEVSDLAGRGVGLDVVRSAVRRSKGDLVLESIPGEGTRFDVVVPVSLSAIRALTVIAASRSVLLPVDALDATKPLAEGDVLFSSDGLTIVHAGRSIPFRALASWLAPEAPPVAPRVAVVIRSPEGLVAIGVDAVRGTRDVIVRRLPAAVGSSSVVAGAAFDTLGDPELVLDPVGLFELPEGSLRTADARAKVRSPVLVIDDSLTTRMLEQSILEAAGYEVDVASSAEEGLAKAGTGRYGLFVVDVEMPGMNGYEFTRETRARPDLRDVPVIMVTSLADEESRKRGREAGISAYIVKGEFDQGGFLSKVAELLS